MSTPTAGIIGLNQKSKAGAVRAVCPNRRRDAVIKITGLCEEGRSRKTSLLSDARESIVLQAKPKH
jgi:hypothetical protein